MALKHLTDQQIQEYLDRNQPEDSRIGSHLENCDACKEQLEQYSKLYSDLKVEAIKLSVDFADSVVSRIAGEASAGSGFQIWHIVLAVAGFGIGLGAAVYLIGLNAIGELFAGLSEFGKVFSEPLTLISNYLSAINLNFGLVGLAAFALIFMVFLDHFVLQSRQRVMSFFK